MAESPSSSPRPGTGLLVAIILLLAVEAWLHTDNFLHRFRSVFAAGRAMDKTLYVQTNPPHLLLLGNSRADNAFDPRTVARAAGFPPPWSAFNLGMPGADTRVLWGVLQRLDDAGRLGGSGVRKVVISLDEALVQRVDTLGQEVFFADRPRMLSDGQWHDWFRAVFRLYGYADNLRQLREPGTLNRFLAALGETVEPVGGGAAEHLGYRAGVGGLQDMAALLRQEAGASAPPDPANVAHLWRMLDLLRERGVRVAVVFPPLLNREVLYRSPERPEAAPYLDIAAELHRRGIPTFGLDEGMPRQPGEFVNAGHLNDRGAQRYSMLLGSRLAEIWPTPR